MKQFIITALLFAAFFVNAQNRISYAGNSGKESFNDVVQLSNGTFLIGGYAENLNWIDASVPKTQLSFGNVKNGNGTNKIGFILQLSADFQQILHVLYFPSNAVENVRFIKLTNIPGEATDQIYFSGKTLDSKANSGGYYIAKLNNNFVNGVPTDVQWIKPVWAEGDIQNNQPWDVGSDGKVLYVLGQCHNYDWAALQRMNAQGVDEPVEYFTTHWTMSGQEYYENASSYTGGISEISRSAIVLKLDGRCGLRSKTQEDFDLWQPDENGGTKKGKYPLDVFYNCPCIPGIYPTSEMLGGYTGYKPADAAYGAGAVVVDRRTNRFYVGLNVKSRLPDANPDFEPAVVAFDIDGKLVWWSRLYHEKNPSGVLCLSTPDQYVDGLAIDYSKNVNDATLIVNARCLGNNNENFWEGNTVKTNMGFNAFHNGFTGNNGNIHYSWIGKLNLSDGALRASTYVAEYPEGANNYGEAYSDPNLDGWPDHNKGWANLNTTRLRPNTIKVSADGSVCTIATGRHTITTANAYQKMVLPSSNLKGTWNDYVRIYKSDLSLPLYSSLITGQWNTSTGTGGSNIDLFGFCKVKDGIVVVGSQRVVSDGVDMPVINVPAWGQTASSDESAVFAFLTAENIKNPNDGYAVNTDLKNKNFAIPVIISQKNNSGLLSISNIQNAELSIFNITGVKIYTKKSDSNELELNIGKKGTYIIKTIFENNSFTNKIIVR